MDVGAFANDVKGVQGHVTTLTSNLRALTQNVDGVNSSISKMAGNRGSVTQDVQKLGSQVKPDNLNLQDTIYKIYKKFKTDLVRRLESRTQVVSLLSKVHLPLGMLGMPAALNCGLLLYPVGQ